MNSDAAAEQVGVEAAPGIFERADIEADKVAILAVVEMTIGEHPHRVELTPPPRGGDADIPARAAAVGGAPGRRKLQAAAAAGETNDPVRIHPIIEPRGRTGGAEILRCGAVAEPAIGVGVGAVEAEIVAKAAGQARQVPFWRSGIASAPPFIA